mgnify:CR=1 FL=1
MSEQGLLEVNPQLSIPMDELHFRFARSSGPGGQNVNRTATRVELLFDVQNSSSLSAEQRLLILRRLRRYIDQRGVLHLFSQGTRSQLRNREEVVERLRVLLDKSLQTPRKRLATRPSPASRERRLLNKRRHSLRKAARRPVGWAEDE